MTKYLLFVSVVFLSQSILAAPISKIKIESKHSLEETSKRYVSALSSAEIPVRGQKEITQKLPGGFSRNIKEIEFSNPYFGWNLGECHRGVRKDEPFKTRIWKDNRNKVWIEYSQPEVTVNKFGVIECGNETDLVQKALDSFADAAAE